MARAQQRFDALLGCLDVGRICDFDGDAAQIISAEDPDQAGVDRHKDNIVLIAAIGRSAFLGHHADHQKRHVAHQYILADWIAAVGK